MAPTTRKSNGIARRPTARQPIPKNVLVELSVSHNKACMFCGQKEISEKLYGQLYQLNDIIVHYFCILLSSRAVQNGADKEGIWGFLYKDIKAELTRGSKETCNYCKKKGATISCCGVKCRKVFHLPCGLKNGSMHQYFQSFKSFCQQHRITQTVDLSELQNSGPIQCAICKDDVTPSPLPNSIWAPCCKRNAWFHRGCIQDLALSAGYFFKCPLCNNVEIFKGRMLTLGIYIPSRDASWETVPNAYVELLERHSSCNAVTCLCPHPEKRKYQNDSSWEIILCNTCGSNGTHKLCSSLKCDQAWLCPGCKVVEENRAKEMIKKLELPELGDDGDGGISVMFEERMSQNREAQRRNIELMRNASRTFSVDDPIVISDDSNDSVEFMTMTYIDPPKQPLMQPVQTPQIRLPVIASYASIRGRNRLGRRFTLTNQSRPMTYVISGSIDLTLDNDDDVENNV
ncbi:G2/M phase-specific E3 ubiquitin-protein ligase-like isoform X2 [Aphis gossypii]|uniref:G2/M phase-specific E3 ubiquitin-protein ligase-like isoform X2 n=1 Tax=Aphis gossypii TaxID=80765 RepID=UPI00100FDAF2|nr:G2/M phase-specific E3 ubiquitin-protein ligase-like isoform X2 [Aphis gossypii]